MEKSQNTIKEFFTALWHVLVTIFYICLLGGILAFVYWLGTNIALR